MDHAMDHVHKCTHGEKSYTVKVNYLPAFSNTTLIYFFYVLNDEKRDSCSEHENGYFDRIGLLRCVPISGCYHIQWYLPSKLLILLIQRS